jgi:hypothetical protein
MKIVLAIFSLMMTLTQDAPLWTAWLYDAEAGQVIEVDPAGAMLQSWTPPLVENFDTPPQDIFVSPSGQYMVYSGRPGPDALNALVIYDVDSGELKHVGPLAMNPAVGINAPTLFSTLFDETSTRVAAGYYVGFYGAEPMTNESWEIAIFDTATGEAGPVLHAPLEVRQMVEGEQLYSIPVIQQFVGDVVEFTVIAGGTENVAGKTPVFAWDIQANTVTPIDHYTSLAIDIWPPTGEIVFPARDEAFGPLEYCAGPGAPHVPFNVVERFEPAEGQRSPVYQREGYAPLSATFIQNGERLLIGECGTVEEQRILTVIERDGSVIREIGMLPIGRSIRSVPDGFIYQGVVDGTLPGSTGQVLLSVLVHVRTDDNHFQQTLLWQGPQNIYSLSLVHVSG